MISNWDAPFLYLKAPSTSFFSTQEGPDFLWSSVESGVIRDISTILLNNAQEAWGGQNNPYKNSIATILARSNNSTEQTQADYFWRSKKAHFSLEIFAELDGLGNWDEQAYLIRILLSIISTASTSCFIGSTRINPSFN